LKQPAAQNDGSERETQAPAGKFLARFAGLAVHSVNSSDESSLTDEKIAVIDEFPSRDSALQASRLPQSIQPV
jgi:hypothetical protein